MLDSAETTELRALQTRAYGRGGGLTDAEAARLRELEDTASRRADPVHAVPVGAGGSATATAVIEPAPPSHDLTPPESRGHEPVPGRPSPPAEAVQPHEAPLTASSVPTSRRPGRWRAVIGGALIAVVGVGVGWLLFGDRGPQSLALTDEQQGWQNQLLASAEYDAGSLRALAEEEGVVVWYATKKDAELACIILGDGENTRPSCTTAADIALQGLFGQFRTTEGESEREFSAQVLLDSEGDPAATVSSFLMSGEILEFRFATPEEEEAAAELSEAGFDTQSLWIIGRDGDVPLWTGVKPATTEQCLIYDGSDPDPEMTCADTETLWQEGGSLVLDRADAETGDLTRFEHFVGGGGSYLTITKGIERTDAS
ncbi:hypothetical protein IPV10_16585, partial [Microbacterium sp. SD291]|nr:hypothetical protein [Microbacterium sp. SD291]